MRRSDKELNRTETDEILVAGNYGVLSINGESDYAYGVPVSYVYIDNSIYFHCALEGQKLTCIRKNNKVSFCVVGKAQTLPDQFSVAFASVIVFGTAREVCNEEKSKAFIAFLEKYSSNYMDKGKAYIDSDQHKTVVIKIDIDHVTGKARKI